MVLSAPTSFGKSLLIDALLAERDFRHAAVVVPTVALMDVPPAKTLPYPIRQVAGSWWFGCPQCGRQSAWDTKQRAEQAYERHLTDDQSQVSTVDADRRKTADSSTLADGTGRPAGASEITLERLLGAMPNLAAEVARIVAERDRAQVRLKALWDVTGIDQSAELEFVVDAIGGAMDTAKVGTHWSSRPLPCSLVPRIHDRRDARRTCRRDMGGPARRGGRLWRLVRAPGRSYRGVRANHGGPGKHDDNASNLLCSSAARIASALCRADPRR